MPSITWTFSVLSKSTVHWYLSVTGKFKMAEVLYAEMYMYLLLVFRNLQERTWFFWSAAFVGVKELQKRLIAPSYFSALCSMWSIYWRIGDTTVVLKCRWNWKSFFFNIEIIWLKNVCDFAILKKKKGTFESSFLTCTYVRTIIVVFELPIPSQAKS